MHLLLIWSDVKDTLPPTLKVFTVVQEMPYFPGGEHEMMIFIQQHIHYPEKARMDNTQGRVVVGFVVDVDGSLTNLSIKKGVRDDLDEEALRVVRIFPKFMPGKEYGQPVRVSFILPIRFTLEPPSSPVSTTK